MRTHTAKIAGMVLFAFGMSGCNWDILPSHARAASVPGQSDPTFTSGGSVDIQEGVSQGIYTASADDPESDPLTFSLSGGADRSMFSIDTQSGVLSLNTPPDFENPADSDGNNDYELELRVEDGRGGEDVMSLMVNVANLNEAPIFTSGATASTPENIDYRYFATVFDPEQDSITFSISGGADQAVFGIDQTTGALSFNSTPDFDQPLDAGADNIYHLIITADDGNGGDAQQSLAITVTDISRLDLDVSFPTPNANLGGIATTTVSGFVDDLEDNVIEADDIVGIDVNAQAANWSFADPRVWTSAMPVAAPTDQVLVRATPTSGSGAVRSFNLQNDAIIIRPDLLAMDVDDDRLLVADSAGNGALVSVALASELKSMLFDGSSGSGPAILYPESAVLDELNDQIFIVDSVQRAIISLDVSSGDRTLISDDNTGSGPVFDNPLSITLDAVNDRVLVADAGLESLLSVSLSTGDRSIVSSETVGSGPTIYYPTAITLDATNGRVLIADPVLESIIGVDLVSGNRTSVADASTGAQLDFPVAVSLYSSGTSLLVIDINRQALISIDLLTGAGVALSDAATGSGPAIVFPRSLAVNEIQDRAFITDVGLNQILSVDLASGDRTTYGQTLTGNGPSLAGATSIALHAASERVLVSKVEPAGASLVWTDLNNGNRAVLADQATGTGPALESISSLAMDPANGRVLLADDTLGALLSADLATGDRIELSSASRGAGVLISDPVSIALDLPNDRVLVVDRALNALVSVDLTSGDRVVISGAGIGLGPALSSPTAVAIDSANNRALLVDSALEALIAVDIATGNRTVIADAATGAGPAISVPRTLDIDTTENRALIADGRIPASLYSVDLATGDRTIVSDRSSVGPNLINVPSVVGEYSRKRLFAIDADLQGLIVIDRDTGQRAIVSR